MPVNYETPTGYYDGAGVFHQNTGLLPSPVTGVSYTIPINPKLPYNPFPDVQPYIPPVVLPKFPDLTFPASPKLDLGGLLGNAAGSFAGGLFNTAVFPAALLLIGYGVAKNRGGSK